MANSKNEDGTEMSMEEILASIRRYVNAPPAVSSTNFEKRQEYHAPVSPVITPALQLSEKQEINQDSAVKPFIDDPVILTNPLPTPSINPQNKVKSPIVTATEVVEESPALQTPVLDEAPFKKLQEEIISSTEHDVAANALESFMVSLAKPMINKWLDKNLEEMVKKIATELVMQEIAKMRGK